LGITFEEGDDALKKAREINAAEKKQKKAEAEMKLPQQLEAERVAAEKKQKEAEEAMKLQQQLEAERVTAEKKQNAERVDRYSNRGGVADNAYLGLRGRRFCRHSDRAE
jgi:membrane protein involved in colicin uptake